METKRINRGLQILRVIACFAVVIVHLGQRLELRSFIVNYTNFGARGVQMFIIISGYLAAMAFKDKEKVNVLDYYKKRALRILPLYYIVIAYYFVTENLFFDDIPDDVTGLGWLRYIFLLNGFIGAKRTFWRNLGITWTIPLFVFFYFITPFICRLFRNWWSMFILFLASQYFSNLISMVSPDNFLVFQHLPCFILGMLVLYGEKENKVELTVSVLICIIIRGYASSGIGIIEISCLFAVLLTSLRNIRISNPVFVKILETLDEYSYTVYLVHGIIFCGFIDKFDFTRPQILLLTVFGTAVLSVIFHKCFEVPLQNTIKKFLFKTSRN